MEMTTIELLGQKLIFGFHGDTAVDSHLGLPRADKTLEELEAEFRGGSCPVRR